MLPRVERESSSAQPGVAFQKTPEPSKRVTDGCLSVALFEGSDRGWGPTPGCALEDSRSTRGNMLTHASRAPEAVRFNAIWYYTWNLSLKYLLPASR